MKKIAIALTVATALFASDADYHWEFTPTVGGVLSEGNIGTQNHFTYGLRIAKNLEDAWINQIEIGLDRSSDVSVKNAGDTDVMRYFVNVVKDIYSFSDNFKVYGLLGAGYEDYRTEFGGGEFADIDDGGFGQYGLGLKYFITDNFALKTEVRDAITFEHANHNMFYTLGFAANFGERAPKAAPAAVVAPAPVVEPTPVLDDDNDGVPNDVDRCPGTPAGVVVDEYGCEKVIRLTMDVNFAFDSSKITPAYMEKIKEVANTLNDKPDYKVILEGHTDSTGAAEYNMKLSQRRADAVAKALVDLGIDKNRISTEAYGETKPIADNATKAGRAQNRRTDAKFRFIQTK